MDLPVTDPLSKANFLSIEKKRAYIDTWSPSLEAMTSNLPAVKEDTIMKKRLAKGMTRKRDEALIGPTSKWS